VNVNPVAETEHVATTFAVTWKVVVAVAADAVEARPSVKHPKIAADSTDLTVFENFIEMTPGRN
jgi:hypothetical protein